MGRNGLKGTIFPMPGSNITSYSCLTCGEPFRTVKTHRCPACGGIFSIPAGIQFDRTKIESALPGIWRYRETFGLPVAAPALSLGEGNTPLIPFEIEGHLLWLKMESANPTGSYKDRLAAVLVSQLIAEGIDSAVEDSSGNAGAAFAAYCARAGIKAKVFVPGSAAGPKRAQIERLGAEVVAVPGPRQAAADAVLEDVAQGEVYASHAFLPQGMAGIATIAYELVDQLGQFPGTLLAPVGHGGLLLGIVSGFHALLAAGEISALPKFFGVQAANTPTVWAQAQGEVFEPKSTIAGGIEVTDPVRGPELVELNQAGIVDFLVVEEAAILSGKETFAHCGVDVEPTSAIVMDACSQLFSHPENLLPGPIVAVISGHGMKA